MYWGIEYCRHKTYDRLYVLLLSSRGGASDHYRVSTRFKIPDYIYRCHSHATLATAAYQFCGFVCVSTSKARAHCVRRHIINANARPFTASLAPGRSFTQSAIYFITVGESPLFEACIYVCLSTRLIYVHSFSVLPQG